MRGGQEAASLFPGPAQDVCWLWKGVCFLGGYFEIGLVKFLEDGRICVGGFFVSLTSHKDVVCDLAAFPLLQLFLDDFGEEVFEFFGLA